MLKLTKKADYGLIAMKYLAEQGAKQSRSAKEIAEAWNPNRSSTLCDPDAVLVSSFLSDPGDARMVNRDQVAGIAKQMKGSVKQAAGKATGNRRTQVEGAADKIAGKVQKAYGDAKDKVRKAF